jgi:hypothetical protein
MPAPFFTTNDSDVAKLEGLYVKERNPPAVISGANLNVVGVVGEAVRGPVDKAILIGSEARFKEVFGGARQVSATIGSPITSMLWKALMNKPFGQLQCVRAAASGATTGVHTLSDAVPTVIATITANGPGSWSGNVTYSVEAASDGVSQHWNLRITYDGKDFLYRNIDTTTGNDNTAAVVGTDDGRPITLTKNASGRPVTGTGTLSTGSDGTIADSDFTASNRGVNVLASTPGVSVVFIAERSSTALKSVLLTLAAAATDRMYLMSADSDTTAASSAETDAASYIQADGRVIYCFNHPYTIDNDAAAEVVTFPTSWMASILSQTDIDIHPGEEDTKKMLAGITRLSFPALTRADYIALHDAGIAAMESNQGFQFVSGVTTSQTSGKQEITRRRMCDYLQLSVANQLRFSVKKKNTLSRRKANAGMIAAFLNDLELAERVVQDFSVDPDILNTDSQRAQGIEKILMRVKLIGHMLHLVLETEIGTSVSIKQTQ